VINLSGDSLHARQIKEVSFSIDNGVVSKPVAIDVDTVTFSFSTRSASHNIALKIRLIDGRLIESAYQWGISE
jgi:hypothetical protein